MYELLTDMRVIEGSSFVASPSCGLYLAQLGAEVIRFDMIGGGPDFHRWPRTDQGASLYWEGLNKGKKSIALDLTRPEGRELAQNLVTARGERGGIFVTNYPQSGFLAHERLAVHRPDLITIRVMGQANGANAMDHTVNCAVGIPQITGPVRSMEPVNHVLPAWDLLTGAYTAFSVLAAERFRRKTGKGQEVCIPLADVAISSVAHLGQLAEVLMTNEDRPRYGNDVYGAFGRDFITADGCRLMIMAITPRQWAALVQALDMAAAVDALEQQHDVRFAEDEGIRFQYRAVLMPIVAASVAVRSMQDLRIEFERCGVCWGPYQTMREAADDPALVRDNPIFAEIDNPSGLRYPAPGAVAKFSAGDRQVVRRAPRLGEHTNEILTNILGLSEGEIGRLHDAGIVADAKSVVE